MLLFFAPVLNLAFFLLLSLVPSRRAAADADLSPPALLARIIPDSALGRAAWPWRWWSCSAWPPCCSA